MSGQAFFEGPAAFSGTDGLSGISQERRGGLRHSHGAAAGRSADSVKLRYLGTGQRLKEFEKRSYEGRIDVQIIIETGGIAFC